MSSLFAQLKYQPKNSSVVKLIADFESSYNPVFNKIKGQWLPVIREFLREETGLRMHQKLMGEKTKKDSNVSFHFLPDRNETFIRLIDHHYPDLNFNEYAAFRTLRSQLKNSDLYFLNNSDKPIHAYREISNYLDYYFKKYNLESLIQTLFKNSGTSADIWGTYFLNDGRIDIYYLPLILFCQIHTVSLENAIISTLVHEVAYAYHHMGKDKDNVTWTSMSGTDLKIVEGMAEYFTWLFVETYKYNHTDMERTYDIMFKCLGNEYTVFKTWIPIYSKETIKSALLGTRKKSIKKYEEFHSLLQNVKKIMH